MFNKIFLTWILLMVPISIYGLIEMKYLTTELRWWFVGVWILGLYGFGLYKIWRK